MPIVSKQRVRSGDALLRAGDLIEDVRTRRKRTSPDFPGRLQRARDVAHDDDAAQLDGGIETSSVNGWNANKRSCAPTGSLTNPMLLRRGETFRGEGGEPAVAMGVQRM